MSITSDLEQILSARYGKDVRQAIHDSIEEGYNIAVQAEGKATTAQDSASASASAAAQSSTIALQSAQLAEQYKNEAFSGTPEGYADLVAKVNSIYRQTATSYNVVGTSEGSALAHTIYGMSVQDGTPTPSVPVEIQSAKADFRCVGKNLIPYPYYYHTSRTENGITFTDNGDGSVTANGTATDNTRFYFTHTNFPFNVNPKFAYIFSVEFSYSTTNLNVRAEVACYNGTTFIGGSGVWRIIDETGSVVINSLSTLTYDRLSIYVNIPSGVTVNNLTFKPMLTLEDADQTYELYKHTDVTTDLTLRAIEVASTDDYNLVRDGKYYIADTVDWSEDDGYEITRRVASSTISELTGFIRTINWQGKQTFVYRDDTTKRTPSNHKSFALSSGYEPQIRDAYISGTASDYGIFTTPTGGIVFAMPLNSYSSKDDFLADQGNQNVQYVLITPTTEPITSEQAQALLSLKSYDEATSISATGDIEPSLDLEYSKDRNTALALTGHNLAHKNALKLNDINTALIELGGN